MAVVLTRTAADCIDRPVEATVSAMHLDLDKDVLALARLLRNLV